MKRIDMTTWPRRSHYEFYSAMGQPHFGVCFDVDVTATRRFAKERGIKIFNALLYLSCHAVNAVPELRTRVREDGVVEHEVVHAAFTIMGDNNLFNYCRAMFGDDAVRFFREVDENTAINRKADHLVLDDNARDDVVYMTSLPWLAFTGVQHPARSGNADSVPRLGWGRFTEKDGRLCMPYSLQAHHGLADGYHAGVFAEALQQRLNSPEAFIIL